MRVLLLGVGLQGRAALSDLVASEQVGGVLAADREIDWLRAHVQRHGYAHKVDCRSLDAADAESLDQLMGAGVDVAIDLLPIGFIDAVAEAAVRHRVHLVNTNYVTRRLRALADAARSAGVAILPEFGLDPGIDLVLVGEAVRRFDTVTRLVSYGAGIPTPEAADNPLRYKVSWTLEGVLGTYRRRARVIREGHVVEIAAEEIFRPKNVHRAEIEGLGTLEAYPNGDALEWLDRLGLDQDRLEDAGWYTLRWPGHCEFWRKLVDLHLLDEQPVVVDGHTVDRRRFLAAALEPHLQYGPGEQDLCLVRIEAAGEVDGRPTEVLFQLLDRGDPETGFSAMSRTVGFTASIGAQWLAAGHMDRTGLLSPTEDVPFVPLAEELAKRGVEIVTRVTALGGRD